MGVVASAGAVIQVTVLSCIEGGPWERSEWLQLVSPCAGLWVPPMSVRGRTVACFGRFGILYKCPVFVGSASVDTMPVTGSLHFAAYDCRLVDLLAVGLTLYVSWDSTDCLLLGMFRALRIVLQLSSATGMVTGGVTPADARSGATFDVELETPWNAPEAYIQLDSEGVYNLVTVPDVFGIRGRRPDAAVVKVLLGRDPRSVRALVPDLRVFDWGFHDVTIVDMEDVSAPDISDTDLSLLRRQWPTSIIESLTWMQSELGRMRTKSKHRYKSTPVTGCSFCGKWIKNDMHRHVAMFHLDLGQLWRCPVSWCIVWKGTPQDCMDHLRGSHAVSLEVKTACLDRFFPPRTVRREMWTEALKPCNSGISTDVLL